MRKIENITDLRAEYARLNALKHRQEEILTNDFKDIAESLRPVNILATVASDLFTVKNNKRMMSSGFNILLRFLSERYLLKNSGFFKHFMAFMGQNLANNIVDSKKSSIVDKVKGWFEKLFNRSKESEEGNVNAPGTRTSGTGSASGKEPVYNSPN